MGKILQNNPGARSASAGTARLSLLKEQSIKTIFFFTAFFAVIVVAFILLFLLRDGYPIFNQVGILRFLLGPDWAPTAVVPLYGIFPLIVGTLLVTIGAMVFAVPLSLGCAIYISELASPRMKKILKPAIELLAGIPSVVYGFFGLIVLTNFIRVAFDLPTGETWLAASVLLGIMALPTIISVSEDAISSVPHEYKEGSLAIGATRWQTISRVLVPAALSGIAAAIILGIGRAVGETMAVMMVAGNAAIIPDPIWNILSPLRTLTGTLGIEMGEVSVGSEHYNALFGVAIVLLVITLIINISAVAILRYLKEGRTGGPARKPFIPSRTREMLGKAAQVIALALLLLVLLATTPWWLAALVLLGGAAWYSGRQYLPEHHVETIAFGLITVATLIVLAILVIILQDIVIHGLPALSWEFLTKPPLDSGQGRRHLPGHCRYSVSRTRCDRHCPSARRRSCDLSGRIYPGRPDHAADPDRCRPAEWHPLDRLRPLRLRLHRPLPQRGRLDARRAGHARPDGAADRHPDYRGIVKEYPAVAPRGQPRARGDKVADDQPGRSPAGRTGHRDRSDPLHRPGRRRDRADHVHGSGLLASGSCRTRSSSR